MPKRGCICSVVGCKEYNTNSVYPFHRFPIQKERCIDWVEMSQREDLIQRLHNDGHLSLRCLRICGKHFSRDKYNNDKRLRLKWDAVPNIELPAISIDERKEFLDLSESTESSSEISDNEYHSTDTLASDTFASDTLNDDNSLLKKLKRKDARIKRLQINIDEKYKLIQELRTHLCVNQINNLR